jgi:hypothetical protein
VRRFAKPSLFQWLVLDPRIAEWAGAVLSFRTRHGPALFAQPLSPISRGHDSPALSNSRPTPKKCPPGRSFPVVFRRGFFYPLLPFHKGHIPLHIKELNQDMDIQNPDIF